MNHTLSPGQPRDHLFDNIKALMLFLVPLGHTLDVFIADGNVEEILMKYIYLFHMPIFAFVTGYFTKNLDKARENAVKKCLIPYLVFQGLYILMAVAMLRLGLAQFNGAPLTPPSCSLPRHFTICWRCSSGSCWARAFSPSAIRWLCP